MSFFSAMDKLAMIQRKEKCRECGEDLKPKAKTCAMCGAPVEGLEDPPGDLEKESARRLGNPVLRLRKPKLNRELSPGDIGRLLKRRKS